MHVLAPPNDEIVIYRQRAKPQVRSSGKRVTYDVEHVQVASAESPSLRRITLKGYTDGPFTHVSNLVVRKAHIRNRSDTYMPMRASRRVEIA